MVQFREGAIQILVATEAAGEAINLQCCHILFNYDIPRNPNRLEQHMGRIYRYGQRLLESVLSLNLQPRYNGAVGQEFSASRLDEG